MSKQKKTLAGALNYWQSADLNSRSYIMYRDWILSMAIKRYKWIGLPDTCDIRYLEWTLATQGQATIAYSDQIGAWVSTQATSGPINLYDNPTSWESIGNNGWRLKCTPSNAVIVYDNTLRYPIWNQIDLWAQRLAEYDRVLDMNLQQLKVPWIATAPQEKQLDMINIIKQAQGGEPAILGLKGIEDIKIDLMMTPVEFRGNDIQEAKAKQWREIYTFLGINNIDYKGERMIEAEVMSSESPIDIRALDGLEARREAAEYLNKTFGLDVHVYFNKDNESENYNLMQNIGDMADQEILEVNENVNGA